ncbi:MFS transporter, partial [Mycobacterium tuberculosis]|nr:MFS transporter [Mycobacterium tuberculosis]
VPTIGLMMAIVGWGTLLDRYGERTILMISISITLVGTSAAALSAAAHASYVAIAACLFVAGLGSGAANGASGRIVVGW